MPINMSVMRYRKVCSAVFISSNLMRRKKLRNNNGTKSTPILKTEFNTSLFYYQELEMENAYKL